MEFKVEITETLARVVEVDAESQAEAIAKVRSEYFDSKIVLDAGDYTGVNFNTL